MEDFIDNDWVDAIEIGFNKTIAKNANNCFFIIFLFNMLGAN